MSTNDIGEDQPMETKEEGEWTDGDDSDIPPLVAISDDSDNETQNKDPWNDVAFDLQARLNQLRWDFIEPEADY